MAVLHFTVKIKEPHKNLCIFSPNLTLAANFDV